MTMIEKVARAIWKSESDLKWEDCSAGGRRTRVRMAKEAIEAMRDIDDKLMYKLEDEGYDAMIDAALKED